MAIHTYSGKHGSSPNLLPHARTNHAPLILSLVVSYSAGQGVSISCRELRLGLLDASLGHQLANRFFQLVDSRPHVVNCSPNHTDPLVAENSSPRQRQLDSPRYNASPALDPLLMATRPPLKRSRWSILLATWQRQRQRQQAKQDLRLARLGAHRCGTHVPPTRSEPWRFVGKKLHGVRGEQRQLRARAALTSLNDGVRHVLESLLLHTGGSGTGGKGACECRANDV